MDLILEARTFFRGALTDVEIALDTDAGVIESVKRSLSGSPRRSLKGQILLPSAVDWHVHMRDPGAPLKEDFASGTKAAALGGVGLVLDMPNTSPVVDRLSRLREKAESVSSKACVDWGLWATVTSATPDPVLLAREAAGLKLYLSPTTNAEAAPGDEAIRNILHAATLADRWVAVHAEGPALAAHANNPREHDLRRDAAGEVEAIERLVRLATEPEHVHIAHATTEEAVAAAAKAGFSVGATPHHLLLSHEESADAFAKVNPPLRARAQAVALLRALAAGQVRHVESDHAPHTVDEKRQRFDEAPAGLPGVQTMVPLLLARAKRGDVSIAEVVRACCERPGQDLGVPIGRIEPGAEASFFTFDPKQVVRIKLDQLASRCGWSPFVGQEAMFPVHHFLRGQPVVEHGAYVGRPGSGRQVRVPGRAVGATGGRRRSS